MGATGVGGEPLGEGMGYGAKRCRSEHFICPAEKIRLLTFLNRPTLAVHWIERCPVGEVSGQCEEVGMRCDCEIGAGRKNFMSRYDPTPDTLTYLTFAIKGEE